MWESWIEFLASGFGLIKIWLSGQLESRRIEEQMEDLFLFLILSLFPSLSFILPPCQFQIMKLIKILKIKDNGQ